MPDGQWIQHLCGRLDRGEIDSARFLDAFTRQMAAHIGCSRAGLWVFADSPSGRILRSLAMYDAVSDRIAGAADIVNTELGPYFDALLRDGCVVAPNARTHPATAGFLDEYLLPFDVHSLLDVCFSVNGTLYGTFSCAQVGMRAAWTQRQLKALRQIGARASLTLLHAAASAAELDTAPGALWTSSTPNRLTQPSASDADDT